jgi:hypothetical protein
MQIVKICQKIKGQPNFCLLIAMYSKFYTKTALSLYFWADCNHSHAIITRIVSRFRFFSKIEIRQVQLDWRGFQST